MKVQRVPASNSSKVEATSWERRNDQFARLVRFSPLLISSILFSQRTSRITRDANNAHNLTNHIHSHLNRLLYFTQDHASRRCQHRRERPRRHHPQDDRGSWMHHRHAALQHTERGKKP